MRHRIGTLLGTAALISALSATGPAAEEIKIPAIGPDQLSFSIENMDRSADPAKDFYRYASGSWLDRVQRPEQLASIGVFEFMFERLKLQMRGVTQQAAKDAATAEKGSPTKQVGNLYASFMDVASIDAKGITPIKPELARIDAIASLDDLARYIGHYTLVAQEPVLTAIVPSPDQVDATKMVLFVVSGSLGLALADVYNDPETSPRIQAYRTFLEDTLEVAEYTPSEAKRVAALALDLERSFHVAKITPEEAVDPRNTYFPKPFAAIQTDIPELDLSLILKEMGITPPETLVLTEQRYLPALSKMLKTRPLADFKDYLKMRMILRFRDYLTTRFDEPTRALNQALVGIATLPPREERALDLLRSRLPHPTSRLYVDQFFSPQTRDKASDMVERIHAAFVKRIQTRTWLSEETRKAATEKLADMTFRIGYPDVWIDYSAVDIEPDNLAGNVMRLLTADAQRDIAKIGKPVVVDQFSDPSTLPMVINAGYSPQINGFEVPAAILQPAAFEADRDAPLYFCRIGAVLGHEMTHGFDSGGRLFDSKGNMRDWWTKSDATAFEAEAQKLIDQANAFEILPGLNANGPLNVRENLADVGGINLAYDALTQYLAEHPAENVSIDGLTPTQRCFLSWAQMWTMKATDQALRNTVKGDNHPPGMYRAVAALQHVDAFYEAFDIKPGDKMWLAPERRVHAW